MEVCDCCYRRVWSYLNESGPHSLSSGQYFSSSPFGQSGIPSQSCGLDIHRPESHVNSCVAQSLSDGAIVVNSSESVPLLGFTFEQPSSSEPSPQSLIPLNNKNVNFYSANLRQPFIPSHFHQYGTQRSFLHLNIQS